MATTRSRKHKLFEKVEGDIEDDNHRGIVVGERQKKFVFDEGLLANYAPTELNEGERAAWIKEKTKELRRNRREFDEREECSPRHFAYEAWNEANKVTIRLSEQLIETRPATMAGVAAVLAHWSRVMDENEHDRDVFSTREFLKKIAEAVQAIDGPSS